MKEKTSKFVIITVIALILFSIIIKIPSENKTYWVEDATYHVLYTMKCYDQTPISVHKFLPIVSLGGEENKNIPWGLALPDNEGNYYYTSFSAAGFVAPYIFIKAFHLPINIYSLYAFNSLMCIASLAIITIIFIKMFSKYINKNWIILLTAIGYLFQIEVVHSQGAVFWIHSIMQVLIGIQFLLFMNYEKSKKHKIWFYIMCVILPYAEWTGYVGNVALGLIFFIRNIKKNKKLTIKCFKEPVIIALLTILSFGIFSLHFLLNINFNELIKGLTGRFIMRSQQAEVKNLLLGYIHSYGYLIILNAIIAIILICIKKYRKTFFKLIKEYRVPIFFFTFIMLENILMFQHAVVYTFDRLKFAYLVLLILFINISTIVINKPNIKNKICSVMIGILAIISFVNILQYKLGVDEYVVDKYYATKDKLFANYIKENYNTQNSIIANKGFVRGYLNLLFERGIYELKTYDELEEIKKQNNKRYMIYFSTVMNDNIEFLIIKDLEKNEDYRLSIIDNQVQVRKINTGRES